MLQVWEDNFQETMECVEGAKGVEKGGDAELCIPHTQAGAEDEGPTDSHADATSANVSLFLY